MSDREKDLANDFSKTFDKLDEVKKSYLAGLAEGMVLAKENSTNDSEEEYLTAFHAFCVAYKPQFPVLTTSGTQNLRSVCRTKGMERKERVCQGYISIRKST